MTRPLCETEWKILTELRDGNLLWGAAVGAVWRNLVAHGYAQPNFGDITEAGREAVDKMEETR